MENVSVAIVSADKAYRDALSMSLLSACRNLVIKTFDCRDFVKSWAEYKGKKEYYELFDLVLWAGSEIADGYGDNIVYLAEKPSMIRRDFGNKKFCLYKYSNAQSIVSSIFEIYGFLTGHTAVCMHAGDVRLLAFSSWAGGTGCTTVARAVAQDLCRFGNMRVLYLSLEEIESTGDYVKCQPGARSVGEYLYRLFRNKTIRRGDFDDNIPFLDGFIVKDIFGIESFSPTKGRNPLRDLSEKDMQCFLSAIVDSGRYNAVVMDLGDCLSDAGIAAMQMAEKVCFVARQGDSRKREEQYVSHIICSAGEGLVDKALKAVNMAECDVALPDCRIRPYENISSMEDSIEIILEGGFGEDIRVLAGKMLKSAKR